MLEAILIFGLLFTIVPLLLGGLSEIFNPPKDPWAK
jgi:hypothetical protein